MAKKSAMILLICPNIFDMSFGGKIVVQSVALIIVVELMRIVIANDVLQLIMSVVLGAIAALKTMHKPAVSIKYGVMNLIWPASGFLKESSMFFRFCTQTRSGLR